MRTKQQERKTFEYVNGQVLAGVENIRRVNPAAAEYLEQHLVIDEVAMTFQYTGDDRLKLTRLS